jgi:hypothetical protein
MDVKVIQETAIRDLESIILGIRNIEFIEELSYSFNTQEIQNAQFVQDLLDEIREQIDHARFKYIYTFSLPDNCQVSSVYERYKAAKNGRKAERAYARLNPQVSCCLYVGSSNDLIPRIKQHLGFGPKGTFAMQLCHWCENASLDLTLKIYSFASKIDKKAFQAFEDGVWESLKPMLGRQGKK